jgi:hypothetical protein
MTNNLPTTLSTFAAPADTPGLRPEWSMRLVMDVALNVSTESILEAHELTWDHFERICKMPTFVMQVETMRKELDKEGATFRLKCQLQADHYLVEVHKKIMDPSTDEKVFTRLVEDVVRWGGLDAPAQVNDGGLGGFSININFGQNKDRGITIDAEKA